MLVNFQIPLKGNERSIYREAVYTRSPQLCFSTSREGCVQLLRFYKSSLLIENYKNFNYVSTFSIGSTQCYEALSSDMQKNALSALVQLGAVKKKKM